ncbi:MAG: putative Zn-dependent protease [Alteromonadaceae bacterium]|jgi:predicted Zn-dependent protease
MKKVILAAVTISLLAGCQITKSPTGRTQALMYSSSDMSQLGGKSFDEMKKQQKILKDPQIIQYVNCVAKAITDQVDPSYGEEKWDVVVFDSEQVNAFALPGGHIGVYTGLLKVANSPAQLAAVLGHEVGHVLANHSNERLSRNQLTNVGLQIAGQAMDMGSLENKKIWMQGLGLGAQYGIAMPFGRSQESESDDIGLDLMAKAGFDPQASVTLWQAMGKASGGKQPMEILSTHPSNETRINDLTHNMPKALAVYNQAYAANMRPDCGM